MRFPVKRIPLTKAQTDTILWVLDAYGYGAGSIVGPLYKRISTGERLTDTQEKVIKALLERTAELAGPGDADEIKVILKLRLS